MVLSDSLWLIYYGLSDPVYITQASMHTEYADRYALTCAETVWGKGTDKHTCITP